MNSILYHITPKFEAAKRSAADTVKNTHFISGSLHYYELLSQKIPDVAVVWA